MTTRIYISRSLFAALSGWVALGTFVPVQGSTPGEKGEEAYTVSAAPYEGPTTAELEKAARPQGVQVVSEAKEPEVATIGSETNHTLTAEERQKLEAWLTAVAVLPMALPLEASAKLGHLSVPTDGTPELTTAEIAKRTAELAEQAAQEARGTAGNGSANEGRESR